MKLQKIFIGIFIFTCVHFAQAQNTTTTSLHLEDCQLIEESELDLTSKFRCAGASDFKVYYKISDLRGWIELEKDGKIYDTWEMITANAIGLSPYVGEELIWQWNKNGNLEFLIFEVLTQDPQNVYEEIKLYFVAGMSQSQLVFVTQAESLEVARQKAEALVIPRP